MKYIRTKDKIIETTNIDIFTLYFELSGEKSVAFDKVNELLEKMITKQADTIEELCDEFVWDKDLIDIDFKNKKVNLKNDDYYFELNFCLKEGNIFGAIWTDKGLIYVAKMNEKGELELL